MARLLRDTIGAGVPPSVAVLPMTPEEVAASYDNPVAETGPSQPGPDTPSTEEDRAS
jgi:hypothetical protein